MRTRVVATIIAIGALGAFLYAQPLLTIRALARALEESDEEAMRERMDAERVRHSLRDDFIARLDVGTGEANDSAAGVVSLALFSRGIEMIIAIRASGDGRTEITDWGYEAPSRFHAVLRQETGAPMTLVLRRNGMSWQVTAMKPVEAAWRKFERYTDDG